MNIEELNQRYGAPGRIVFHEGLAGYPNVVIANKYGAAEISLLGANVFSYRPTGQSEVLFNPAKKFFEYNRSDKVHAGIPVCWPQFGNRFSQALPMHGFARLLVFEVRGTEYSDEITEITLGLKSDAETLKLWPHEFDLEYKVSVSMKLNLSLTTTNTGKEAFSFSCGFHPYFLVRDRRDITVKGVKGENCLFSVNGEEWQGERQEDFRAVIASDDVFKLKDSPKHEAALLDPGLRRAIAVVSKGNDNLVVWNPGEAEIVSGHEAGDWQKFLCVEPVSDWPGGRLLAAGEKYELAAAIQSTLEQ